MGTASPDKETSVGCMALCGKKKTDVGSGEGKSTRTWDTRTQSESELSQRGEPNQTGAEEVGRQDDGITGPEANVAWRAHCIGCPDDAAWNERGESKPVGETRPRGKGCLAESVRRGERGLVRVEGGGSCGSFRSYVLVQRCGEGWKCDVWVVW